MFQKTKNAFDARFNGQEYLLQDEDGYLYIFGQDREHYKGLQYTEVELAGLRKAGVKSQLQDLWERNEFDAMFDRWQEFKVSQQGIDGIPALVDKVFAFKAKLEKGTNFRLTDLPEVDGMVNRLLKQGMKPSKVHRLFFRNKLDGDGIPVTDTNGKNVKEEAFTLATVTNRHAKLFPKSKSVLATD